MGLVESIRLVFLRRVFSVVLFIHCIMRVIMFRECLFIVILCSLLGVTLMMRRIGCLRCIRLVRMVVVSSGLLSVRLCSLVRFVSLRSVLLMLLFGICRRLRRLSLMRVVLARRRGARLLVVSVPVFPRVPMRFVWRGPLLRGFRVMSGIFMMRIVRFRRGSLWVLLGVRVSVRRRRLLVRMRFAGRQILVRWSVLGVSLVGVAGCCRHRTDVQN